MVTGASMAFTSAVPCRSTMLARLSCGLGRSKGGGEESPIPREELASVCVSQELFASAVVEGVQRLWTRISRGERERSRGGPPGRGHERSLWTSSCLLEGSGGRSAFLVCQICRCIESHRWRNSLSHLESVDRAWTAELGRRCNVARAGRPPFFEPGREPGRSNQRGSRFQELLSGVGR